MEYTIHYKTQNTYKEPVHSAYWQFLIIPENNASQHLEEAVFTNSLEIPVQKSINGYGFETFRLAPKKTFKQIEFAAQFRVFKEILNPFDQLDFRETAADYELLGSLAFRVENERFLKSTPTTTLPAGTLPFVFDKNHALFDNLKALNEFVFNNFKFKSQVTQINTQLTQILEQKKGVCQDFTHLFCALARKNGIPARYVSGYLHQGIGYLGDLQMHAWAECFVPGTGWVGFDPTNNLLAAENHIKVAHGKDYADCPPIKGVVYTAGDNTTTYTVKVISNEKTMSQSQNSGANMEQQMGNSIQKMEFRDLFPKNGLKDQ